ncbi:MAG: class I SAM-dependent methyltransferase [Desulfatitalea sp.]|nr:class I SAM-dependent methyltransferase [Desulfatitalea sp.]
MRNQIYALIFNDITSWCYKNCLSYFPAGSSILDVGIGNGIMLKHFHNLIREKNLNIIGIDINKTYLNQCNGLIENYNLENHIEIHNAPIERYEPPAAGYFNYILFSMSFMLFDDQRLVLDRIKTWLKPDGQMVFFQTLFKERMPIVEFVKPKLNYLTTIDFGRITYQDAFYGLLQEKGISVLEDRLIKKEWFKGEYRMIVAHHANGASGKTTPNHRKSA